MKSPGEGEAGAPIEAPASVHCFYRSGLVTVPAAPESPAAGTFLLGFGLVYGEGPPLQLRAIERADGLLRFLGRGHLHKSEAP